uniref:Ig-like domain-containing protein n=1 Tax=Amphilophus citrinellus TaxID=61819 RepID=A0A3Q0SNY0_AMPCI
MTQLKLTKRLLVSQHVLAVLVEVNEGEESVLLPCQYSGFIPEDEPSVMWTRSDLDPRSVHLLREGRDDLRGQNQRYSGRTSVRSDALDSGDFSLTLRNPQLTDSGSYTCSITDGRQERRLRDIQLQVKALPLLHLFPPLIPRFPLILTPALPLLHLLLSLYICEFTLDPNTAHKFLKLSESSKKVTDLRKEHPYPDHPERFDNWPQVLCENAVTGCCYWEVKWGGKVYCYRVVGRNGDTDTSKFGGSRGQDTHISSSSSSSVSHRVAVYVDCPAGTLSFYRVSSDTLIHLHTFTTTFTEPLYPGFGYGVKFNSSAFLLVPLMQYCKAGLPPQYPGLTCLRWHIPSPPLPTLVLPCTLCCFCALQSVFYNLV